MLRITEVRPMFTNIVVTGDRYEKDMRSGGLIVANKGDLKLWQTVLAVGGSVRGISVGDKVMINVDNYAVRRYDKNSIQNDLDNNPVVEYALNWITIDDADGESGDYLLLTDRDIMYVFTGEEKDEAPIILPKKKVYVN